MCCSELQRVAIRCSVSLCATVCCSMLQRDTERCSVLQWVAVRHRSWHLLCTGVHFALQLLTNLELLAVPLHGCLRSLRMDCVYLSVCACMCMRMAHIFCILVCVCVWVDLCGSSACCTTPWLLALSTHVIVYMYHYVCVSVCEWCVLYVCTCMGMVYM